MDCTEIWIFYDDITGRPLPKELTRQARRNEIKQVYSHKVYTQVPERECYDVTGEPPVGTKWIDINKGMKTSITQDPD